MRENEVEICTASAEDTASLNAANKYGHTWPVGLYVIVDNSRAVLESRDEATAIIKQIEDASNILWPK